MHVESIVSDALLLLSRSSKEGAPVVVGTIVISTSFLSRPLLTTFDHRRLDYLGRPNSTLVTDSQAATPDNG